MESQKTCLRKRVCLRGQETAFIRGKQGISESIILLFVILIDRGFFLPFALAAPDPVKGRGNVFYEKKPGRTVLLLIH